MDDRHSTHSSSNMIKVNPIQPKIAYIGSEKTPVIVIDNFAEDLTSLVSFAQKESEFTQESASFYPGVRANLPKQYVIDTINAVFQLIYDVYQVPTHLRLSPQAIYFSLINQQPHSLKPLQCLPHFDTANPYHFAILHYLQEGEFGGTGFFRHNATGFERIMPNRVENYFASAQVCLDELTQQTPSYFTQSNQHYSLYHQIDYRPNRLVIYPGNLLHSTIINLETDINDNPVTGRLTSNIFIQFNAPANG